MGEPVVASGIWRITGSVPQEFEELNPLSPVKFRLTSFDLQTAFSITEFAN